MKSSRIAVIGCGPKAIALYLKAKILKELGVKFLPEIIIIEKNDIGANWDGSSGYTDGLQMLCTTPEKDLGFPYLSNYQTLNDEELNIKMFEYSWSSYLISKINNRNNSWGLSYEKWIDNGKRHPTHLQFKNYLDWVCIKSGLKANGLIKGNVIKIDIEYNSNWIIDYEINEVNKKRLKVNGIVITGQGEPIMRNSNLHFDHTIPYKNPDKQNLLVFNGKSYWQYLRRSLVPEKFENNTLEIIIPELCKKEKQLNVCVIGGGGAAAAIIGSMIKEFGKFENFYITNVVRNISPMTRGESSMENALYSNPINWNNFSIIDREKFIERTNKGVFSRSLIDAIGNFPRYKSLYVSRNLHENNLDWDFESTSDNKILFKYSLNADDFLNFHCLIDARNFDSTYFLNLFPDKVLKRINKILNGKLLFDFHDERSKKNNQKLLEEHIGEDLSLENFEPKLYLPMLSAVRQGPGFPSLNSLGMFSDKILKPFI